MRFACWLEADGRCPEHGGSLRIGTSRHRPSAERLEQDAFEIDAQRSAGEDVDGTPFVFHGDVRLDELAFDASFRADAEHARRAHEEQGAGFEVDVLAYADTLRDAAVHRDVCGAERTTDDRAREDLVAGELGREVSPANARREIDSRRALLEELHVRDANRILAFAEALASR